MYRDTTVEFIEKQKRPVFIIGDNSTGKSEIGEAIKGKRVLDNFVGRYSEIKENDVVITHHLDLILNTVNDSDIVIVTKENEHPLCMTMDIVKSVGLDRLYTEKGKNWGNFMHYRLLGWWTDEIQKMYDAYKETQDMTLPSNKLLADTIENIDLTN